MWVCGNTCSDFFEDACMTDVELPGEGGVPGEVFQVRVKCDVCWTFRVVLYEVVLEDLENIHHLRAIVRCKFAAVVEAEVQVW